LFDRGLAPGLIFLNRRWRVGRALTNVKPGARRATTLGLPRRGLSGRHDTMNSLLRSVRNPRLDDLSPNDCDVLLANAHVLERGGEEPRNSDLLRGRNLGLLCESEDADDAIRFRRAARNLGARVAFIRPCLSELSEPQTLRNTARMLGRLYDAVECQGLPADLVRQVGDEAGVPVYDGVASKRHPTASLAESLGGTRSLAENRQLVLQAALVSSIR
jgi:ornithine carbamoyltransferase